MRLKEGRKEGRKEVESISAIETKEQVKTVCELRLQNQRLQHQKYRFSSAVTNVTGVCLEYCDDIRFL
jgi:hypothetical protein